MNFLEIITLRAAEKAKLENALEICMQATIGIEVGELVKLNIYFNAGYVSDLSVHILWSLESSSPQRSILGLKLNKILSKFGIVSHTTWIEHHILTREPHKCLG
jgi:hypothetical protein